MIVTTNSSKSNKTGKKNTLKRIICKKIKIKKYEEIIL